MTVLDSIHVPPSWTVMPFGRLALRSREVVGSQSLEPLSVFLDQGVVPRSSRSDNFNRLGADFSKYLVVRPGDVVFNKLRTWQGGLGLSAHLGAVSPAYYVCRPVDRVVGRYLHYLLRSHVYLAELTRVSKWMPPSQFDILWEDLRQLPVLLPDKRTQCLIADFLDRETHRIDALVEVKRKLIDLLAEKRTALISHAVTKGLDPSVPMKYSGIQWIGQVPATWTVAPVGSRFEIQLGKMLNEAAAAGEEQRPYVRNVNVQWWKVVMSDVATMSFDETERAKYRLESGDLLVCEGGEVGRAALWREELDECYYQKAIHRLRPRSSDAPAFLCYALFAAANMDVFRIEGNQSTIVHLTAEQLRAHRFPFPDPEEQRRIVTFLNAKRGQTSAAEEALASQLTLLAEYRRALITAAVTGQIDEATLKGHKPSDEAMGFEVPA